MASVAMASAAVGLAGCSASDRHREPAGAAQPLGTVPSPGAHAAGGEHGQGHVPPVAVAAHAPLLPPTGTTTFGTPGAPAPNHAPPAVPKPGAPAASTPHRAVPPQPLPAPAPPASSALTSLLGFDPEAMGATQMANAVSASRADGKSVLLEFVPSGCVSCQALDRAMSTPRAQAVLAQHYHVVHVDLDRADPLNMAVAAQYGAFGSGGTPLLVVLAPDGSIRGDSAHSGQPRYDEAGVTAWLKQWVR